MIDSPVRRTDGTMIFRNWIDLLRSYGASQLIITLNQSHDPIR